MRRGARAGAPDTCRDDARLFGNEAIESSPSYSGFAAHAFHQLGDVAAHPDRFDADSSEAHYRQALTLAEPRGMRPLVAHCQLSLGKLYWCTSKELGQEHVTTATTMFREMNMQFWVNQAAAEMCQLGWAWHKKFVLHDIRFSAFRSAAPRGNDVS